MMGLQDDQTSDAGFVLVGYTELNGNRDILVVKTNALVQASGHEL